MIAERERAERLTRNGCIINQETYHPEVWTPEAAKGVDLIIVALKYGALRELLTVCEEVWESIRL